MNNNTPLYDAFRLIFKNFTPKSLDEMSKAQILAIFSDLAPALKKERNLVSAFVDVGGITEYLSICRLPHAEQKFRYTQIVNRLIEDYYLSPTAAERICYSFFEAIKSIKEHPNDDLDQTPLPASKQYQSIKRKIELLYLSLFSPCESKLPLADQHLTRFLEENDLTFGEVKSALLDFYYENNIIYSNHCKQCAAIVCLMKKDQRDDWSIFDTFGCGHTLTQDNRQQTQLAFVTIQHMSDTGDILLQKVHRIPYDTPYTVTAESIEGYHCFGPNTQTVILDQNGKPNRQISFTYRKIKEKDQVIQVSSSHFSKASDINTLQNETKKQEATVVVKHLSEDGELLLSRIYSVPYNYARSFHPEIIDGYVCIDLAVKTVIIDQYGKPNKRVYFKYRKKNALSRIKDSFLRWYYGMD